MELKVFGLRVSVKLDSELPSAGLFECDKQLITINPDQSIEQVLQTLLHEVMEVVWFRCSLNQSEVSEEVKEIMIDCFATAAIETYLSTPVSEFIEELQEYKQRSNLSVVEQSEE